MSLQGLSEAEFLKNNMLAADALILYNSSPGYLGRICLNRLGRNFAPIADKQQ